MSTATAKKSEFEFKFRLLHGSYIHSEWVDAEQGDELTHRVTNWKDPYTGKEKLRKLIKKRYFPGDVIQTNKNLAELFGEDLETNGNTKSRFELIVDNPQNTPAHDFNTQRKLMEKLSVDNLRKFAEEEEIDLGEAATKKDIIDTILDARASMSVG